MWPAEQIAAIGAEAGQLLPDLAATLRAHTDSRARAREPGVSARNRTAARRHPSPDPVLPLGPPLDIVSASAASPGGISASPLWCVISTGHAVHAGHELRRLRAPLLAADLPGLSSLRDRPG